MLLEKQGEQAILPEGLDTTQGSIAMTPAMFSILSDKMYTNKIEAVVREVSCNASDAMKAAGKEDVPIQVQLPTIFEPWFSVKDTGLGLSDEEIVHGHHHGHAQVIWGDTKTQKHPTTL